MALVVDFLLLAASGTAGLYCFILSRRLKGLTNANGGLGAGVAALAQSAEEMKSAVGAAKSSADAAASRLEALLVEADGRATTLKALICELEDTGAATASQAEAATKKYVDTLAPFLAEASAAANRLFSALDRAPAPSPPTVARPAAKSDEDFVALDDTPNSLKRAEAGAAA